MNKYHYTEKRQKWLIENKHKINNYMREYMRSRRNKCKGNINIEQQKITISFN